MKLYQHRWSDIDTTPRQHKVITTNLVIILQAKLVKHLLNNRITVRENISTWKLAKGFKEVELLSLSLPPSLPPSPLPFFIFLICSYGIVNCVTNQLFLHIHDLWLCMHGCIHVHKYVCVCRALLCLHQNPHSSRKLLVVKYHTCTLTFPRLDNGVYNILGQAWANPSRNQKECIFILLGQAWASPTLISTTRKPLYLCMYVCMYVCRDTSNTCSLAHSACA